jgi:hypothetical protein
MIIELQIILQKIKNFNARSRSLTQDAKSQREPLNLFGLTFLAPLRLCVKKVFFGLW